MQDEQELEHEGEKVFPLTQKLGLATGSFGAIGLIDLLAHGGPTGLVIAGILAYVAWELGPQLLEGVPMPALPAKQQTSLPRRSRSFMDRLLGRYPEISEGAPQDEEDKACVRRDDVSSDDECDEGVTMPEPIACLESGDYRLPVVVRARDASREVLLAENLGLDIDEVIEAGVFVTGMKGSGKSSLAARLMEQVGHFPLAQIIYDIKGDYVSLLERHVLHGLLYTKEQQYDASTILSEQAQVVVDLRTFPTMEHRARIIANLNARLLRFAMSVSEQRRIPWFVHLDEAQQYVSQQPPVGIETATWKAVTQSVANLGVLGRSYGAVPCLYTQRIASIHKDVISQQELRIFMKASMDNDLRRYEEYVNHETASRADIQAFRAGDGVAILPDGRQLMRHFLPRESKHGSHTPHLEQALQVYHSSRSMGVPAEEIRQQWVEQAPAMEPMGMPSPSPLPVPIAQPHIPRRLQQALDKWNEGANSIRKLALALNINFNQARELVNDLERRGLIERNQREV